MNKKLNFIGLVILTILVFSCNTNNKSKAFDYGRVENGKYLNSFFGLEVDVPKGWVIQTKEQIDKMTKMGKDLVAGDDKKLKAVMKASEINSATLLTVFKYETGSAVDYNPSFTFIAENLKNLPGTKSGSDYLFQVRKLLRQSQMQYDTIDEKFTKVFIDNQEFYLMNATLPYMGMTIKQEYYATIQDRFSLGIIISFTDDEQKNELEKIIQSMKFNSKQQ